MHILYHNHPEIIKVVLSFPEFTSVCKNSAQFIHSFINSSCDQCTTTISDHTYSNIFLSTNNFWYQHVKKYRLFHHFVLDIYLIWNLIGQYQFGPMWMRNKLTDLLILHLAKKMIEEMEKKLKMGFIIMRSNYSYMVLE